MNRYRVKYDTGDIQVIEAERVDYDPEGRQYVLSDDTQTLAFLPSANIVSVIRDDLRR